MSTSDQLRFILGLKLKNLRSQRGLTLKEAAGAAGLSVSYLSELEKGKKYPKADKLLHLARALEVPFDDLVSMRVDESLGPLESAMRSTLLREFPLELFGVRPEDLVSLMTDSPDRASALVRAFLDVGRMYDLQVEHFLLAAMRSYQQMHANYFADLEKEAKAFRVRQGWEEGHHPTPDELAQLLETEHGYAIETDHLVDHPELRTMRSVLVPGPSPRFLVNERLLPAQRAFVFARELGFLHLGLAERPLTSSWIKVESFDQVLNNFRASYFAGAVLMPPDELTRDLRELFGQSTWNPTGLTNLIERWAVTPEMLLYRVTELAPERLGLEELFFARFNRAPGEDRFRLTKAFNLSRVPVPHGMAPFERYCRRWPEMRLLRELGRRPPAPERPPLLVAAQRSHFLVEDADFLVFSLARPLALAPGSGSAVSIGFLVDERLRRRIRFAEDAAIPRAVVNLTCERCPLDDCDERAAEPTVNERLEARRAKERALAELIGS